MDVKLRDTMLMKGDVDAVIAFDYTAIFNLIDNGMKMEDINLLYFRDFGFNFPGNAADHQPGDDRRRIRIWFSRVALGVARAWVAADRDRKAAIAAVTKRERLLRADIELQRIELGARPPDQDADEVKKNGIGYIDRSAADPGPEGAGRRLQDRRSRSRSSDIYDGRFLPPVADRKFA